MKQFENENGMTIIKSHRETITQSIKEIETSIASQEKKRAEAEVEIQNFKSWIKACQEAVEILDKLIG